MTYLPHSDLLVMALVPWDEAALTCGLLTTIRLEEKLSAMPLVAITHADLPLTPAAAHLLQRGRVLRTDARSPKKAA